MSTAKPAAAKKTAKKTPAAAPAAETAVVAKPARRRTVNTAPKKAKKQAPRHDAGRLAQVLIGPIVSEKATLVSEKRNQVVFKVLRDSTKPEIKAAVEAMFKVEVASVQTATQKGKHKKFGRSMGRRDHVKKAYVALKPGQELNFSGESA